MQACIKKTRDSRRISGRSSLDRHHLDDRLIVYTTAGTTVETLYTISTAAFNTHVSRRRSARYTRPLKRDSVRHASVVVFTINT